MLKRQKDIHQKSHTPKDTLPIAARREIPLKPTTTAKVIYERYDSRRGSSLQKEDSLQVRSIHGPLSYEPTREVERGMKRPATDMHFEVGAARSAQYEYDVPPPRKEARVTHSRMSSRSDSSKDNDSISPRDVRPTAQDLWSSGPDEYRSSTLVHQASATGSAKGNDSR